MIPCGPRGHGTMDILVAFQGSGLGSKPSMAQKLSLPIEYTEVVGKTEDLEAVENCSSSDFQW